MKNTTKTVIRITADGIAFLAISRLILSLLIIDTTYQSFMIGLADIHDEAVL